MFESAILSGGPQVDFLVFPYSEISPVSIIPSMTIEGKNYSNVIMGSSEYLSDINDPEYEKRTFYWAKGIGIVKRQIITTGGAVKTQLLLRYN